MLPPAEMFVHDECGGVLVFRSENQGCAFWGVRPADLGQDDPPVFVQARHGWVPFLDRVSLACVELVLSEVRTLAGGGRPGIRGVNNHDFASATCDQVVFEPSVARGLG
ncbi:hypothetical protein [Streptomyces agglomeratus]|uniref:hypothetical protein n=1 Tax=Streptomyces agglomeratus TaxID=285458 RepID=UPI00210BF476|nr:hypothetical protein [Streptomyces agglomeratus]